MTTNDELDETIKIGFMEMRKKIREDLDKSLAKQRKDHPRIESNLIAEFIDKITKRLEQIREEYPPISKIVEYLEFDKEYWEGRRKK